MRLDSDIKRDVEAELGWEPGIEADDIAVAVRDGVVTLTGFVHSYGDRYAAEGIAKRIQGVAGVANDIEVNLPWDGRQSDPEIARDAVAALKDQLPHSADGIQVTVKDGRITLEGNVEWSYQRSRAGEAVRHIKGVKAVKNSLAIRPRVVPEAIKEKIEAALRRNAEFDDERILVEAAGSEVILKGTVGSWTERDEAERVAWRAPGVTNVTNRITVAE
jgi:osmotically-inducible protein OsmY